MTEKPFFITQNGEASMVIESVEPFQEKESLIATLKIIALGEKGCGNNWCHRPPTLLIDHNIVNAGRVL